jgi:TrmH family RNA methyltransferase
MSSARERSSQKRTLLDGAHLVRAYLDRVGNPVLAAVCTDAWENLEIRALIKRLGEEQVLCFPPELFAQIAPVESPSGILALIDIPKTKTDLVNGDFLVLLDGVQDPGNVGTIIRSAAGAGAHAVMLCSRCADPWSPRALRAAMGATFAVEIRPDAVLTEIVEQFQGRVVATAGREGLPPYAVDLTGPVVLLLGSEGAGLSRALAAAATVTVTIPLASDIDSLSVGAAAAVVMFERARQIALKCV